MVDRARRLNAGVFRAEASYLSLDGMRRRTDVDAYIRDVTEGRLA